MKLQVLLSVNNELKVVIKREISNTISKCINRKCGRIGQASTTLPMLATSAAWW